MPQLNPLPSAATYLTLLYLTLSCLVVYVVLRLALAAWTSTHASRHSQPPSRSRWSRVKRLARPCGRLPGRRWREGKEGVGMEIEVNEEGEEAVTEAEEGLGKKKKCSMVEEFVIGER